MPFYLVARGDVTILGQRDEWGILAVELLPAGHHTISHRGMTVPIEVQFDSATVYASKAKGEPTALAAGSIAEVPDDWSFFHPGMISQVTFRGSQDGESVLCILGHDKVEEGPCFALAIEWHNKPPEPLSLPFLNLSSADVGE